MFADDSDKKHMTKKDIIKIFSLTFVISTVFFVAQAQETGSASAETSGKTIINFPVAELGNCANKTECKTFCDKTENIQACIDFAKSHNLVTKDESNKAKQLAEALKSGGPGGCQGPCSPLPADKRAPTTCARPTRP